MANERPLPDWLLHTLETAPKKPGCYLMKNKLGEIVYVGKAKNLHARLSQYFQPGSSDTRFFVKLLDRILGSIELILSQNAKEALLLENELIKRHQPRYNVKLKDDKRYLSIRIGHEHPYPRLQVVRQRKKNDHADYFGPYHSASSVRKMLKVVNRHFHLRTCSDREFKQRTRPCLEYQLGRCPAPCVFPIDQEAYQKNVEEVKLFLKGHAGDLLRKIEAKMLKASEELNFELAAHYRDQMEAIRHSLTPQQVILKQHLDIDAIGFFREGEELSLQVLHLSKGVLVGSRNYPMKRSTLPDEEVLDGFLGAYYDGSRPIPDLVLLPFALKDEALWTELLTDERGKNVKVYEPLRGDKRRLSDLATANAKTSYETKLKEKKDHMRTLRHLQDKLHLTRLPMRIECFDISNIQGTDPVGSMVVATKGELDKKEYRSFKVRGLKTPNDYEMMQEVLTRRFKNSLEKDWPLPDLLLIDGGKGQLGRAELVLKELGLESRIELASLAETRILDEEGHISGRKAHKKPLSEEVSRVPDRVFRPGRKNPVLLKPNSNSLFLLQRLRDEAHRFAITFHRKLRRKRTTHSVLDEIPGVGPKMRQALLQHFGSVKGLKAAKDLEAYLEIPRMSRKLAESIWESLHEEDAKA